MCECAVCFALNCTWYTFLKEIFPKLKGNSFFLLLILFWKRVTSLYVSGWPFIKPWLKRNVTKIKNNVLFVIFIALFHLHDLSFYCRLNSIDWHQNHFWYLVFQRVPWGFGCYLMIIIIDFPFAPAEGLRLFHYFASNESFI